jgi:hypothetical protein
MPNYIKLVSSSDQREIIRRGKRKVHNGKRFFASPYSASLRPAMLRMTLKTGDSGFMNFRPTPTSSLFVVDFKVKSEIKGNRRFMNFGPTPTSKLFVLDSKGEKLC